jgi:NAD(P)-dependent dehydrogenase (short-subunit alcohol dehydrogenase family)
VVERSRRARYALGTPEEIANPIVFAVSDAASYINGGELVADNAMDKSWNSGQAAF